MLLSAARRALACAQPSAPNKQAHGIRARQRAALGLTLRAPDGGASPARRADVVGKPFPEEYDFVAVEDAWYAWWDKMGFFKPEYNEVPPAPALAPAHF